jgi:hypothetical protein
MPLCRLTESPAHLLHRRLLLLLLLPARLTCRLYLRLERVPDWF